MASKLTMAILTMATILIMATILTVATILTMATILLLWLLYLLCTPVEPGARGARHQLPARAVTDAAQPGNTTYYTYYGYYTLTMATILNILTMSQAAVLNGEARA